MTPITSINKDFWTPRKAEKLPIYSPLLPQKKYLHISKNPEGENINAESEGV